MLCVYDDFIGTAKEILTPKHREGLRNLMNFKIKKQSRYNLPDKRVKAIEKMIKKIILHLTALIEERRSIGDFE